MSRYQPLTLDPNPASPNPGSRGVESTPLLPLGSRSQLSSHGSNGSVFNCSSCAPFFMFLPLCAFQSPTWMTWIFPNRKQIVGYGAGLFFALGWWAFIDGLVYTSVRGADPGIISPAFEDWLPGIFSTLGLIIVNLIDRETLSADDFAYSGSSVATKARAFAFVGVTLSLGALGGALADLCLKFIIPQRDLYFGQVLTVQSFLIFLSSMIFWFGRNLEREGAIAI